MATKKTTRPSGRMWMIDPIYRKFTTKAFKALTSGEFYDYFQTMLLNGEHTFQFSNRKLNMVIDEEWVKIIEDTIPAFMEITRNPRVIITQEELVTNVVQAKKIDSQVIRHLCAHSYLVDAIDEDTGEVIPNKVLNLFKEESWNTYENRFVYTLLMKTYDFVRKRYQDIQEAMNGEFGATLKVNSSAASSMETMSIVSEMRIKQTDDFFQTVGEKKSIFSRIQWIYDSLQKLIVTRFAKELHKYPIVKPPLVPTNAIKKNPYLRKCHALWNFLMDYFDAGFTVEIIEQNPEINRKFEQDIFNNIMFTYIILKGYLEDNRDRAMDKRVKSTRRVLTPRYIREIVDEIVKDYNIPEVEVRKVLIERLTKEELMREERSERYRIVEEQKREKEEQKRLAELEKARLKKIADDEKRRLAKEKEAERKKQLKLEEQERERAKREREHKEKLDQKRKTLFRDELEQTLGLINQRRERQAELAKEAALKQKEKEALAKKKEKEKLAKKKEQEYLAKKNAQ